MFFSRQKNGVKTLPLRYQGLWVICLVILGETVFPSAGARQSIGTTTSSSTTANHASVTTHRSIRTRERAIPSAATAPVPTTSPAPTSAPADDDDEKKSLAQQVADGKYGLIQKELFSKPPKRPGILSYEANPEVPKDNVNNLGGLQPEEIWLAENHLLVLKGGGLRDSETGQPTWPPIDDYVAPKRQVKIPSNPQVPPPFPVQLSDGGPVEFLRGANGTGGPPPFALPPPFPLPPPPFNRSAPLPPLPPGLPPFPPFFPFPPGGNLSAVDEDDPRLYYPPPYDFVYRKDNSSQVPPGPLVPGIVLPPPPDFFAPLEPKVRQRPTKPRPSKPIGKRPPVKPINRIRPYTTTTPPPFTKSTPIFTTSPPPPYTTIAPPYTTVAPLYSTTAAPFSTYPPVNEINPHVPKIEIGEWIPIVGPSLCLLDGKNCIDIPYKNGEVDAYSVVYNNTSPDLYQVDINNIMPVNKVPTYTPRTRQYYTTTPAPYTVFKPVIVNPVVTTPQYNEVDDSRYKQKETYYFYEEPVITEAKVIDAGNYPAITTPVPTVVYVDHGPKYETNTIPPVHSYRDEPVRKPKVNKVKPSRLHIYEQELNKFVGSDLDYLLSKGQFDGYTYPQPDYARQRTRGPRTRNKYEPRQRPHSAVFEYSFSAPGYGTRDTPKISTGIPTTQRPWEEWTDAREEPRQEWHQEWREPTRQEWREPSRQEWREPSRQEWREPVRQEWQDPPRKEWPDPPRKEWEVLPGHSISGDTAVNWRRPHPAEPLAEILPGFVSYRLPGDGGHFFFLTPRAVRAESYHPASAGVRRPRRNRQTTRESIAARRRND